MDRRNDRHKGVQHMPGEEVGLVGERPESRSNYLANLLLGFGLKALAATIRARWICEQAYKNSASTLEAGQSQLGDGHRREARERLRGQRPLPICGLRSG